MPCFSPIPARKLGGGGITFNLGGQTRDQARALGAIDIPCGQCLGCRLQRSRDWAIRIMHEASLYEANCFATFTYSDETQPPTLQYRDFQLFLKRLRKYHFSQTKQKLRFYMVGEYGSNSKRAHFHACLFNIHFSDQKYYRKSHSGDTLYTSEILTKLWGYGFATLGSLTLQSAAYCARYICTKVTGDLAEAHYQGRQPEFNCMSRRPGIGAAWLDKFRTDVFPCDYVVSAQGRLDRVPKFYDKRNAKHDQAAHDQVKAKRINSAREHWADNTTSRLRTKEVVKAAAVKQLVRDL